MKYQTVNYLFISQLSDQYPKKREKDSSLTAVGMNPSQKGYSTARQCCLGAVWLETVVLHTMLKFKRNHFSVKVHLLP